eukprot:6465810-Amphidinium_carterae.1
MELIQKHSKLSASLSRAELVELGVLCGCASLVLHEEVQSLVSGSAGPWLFQFGQDTTKVRRNQIISYHAGKRGTVKRGGSVTNDFCVQCLFIGHVDGEGTYRERLEFGRPTPLEYGKKSVALAAVALDQPGLDSCSGDVLQLRLRHQVYDRAYPVSFAEFMSGHWNASACSEESGEETSEQFPWHFLELHTHVGCAIHDSHNALKWSSFALFSDSLVQQNAYLGLVACKNAFMRVTGGIGDWLLNVVRAVPEHDLPGRAEVVELWEFLGVTAQVETLADSRVHWQGDHLCVSETFLRGVSWLELLSGCLLDLWKFHPWTASRWATLGPASRSYVVGALLGFHSMCSFLYRLGLLSDYDVAGMQKLDTTAKILLVTTALVAYPSEKL